ncbi:hypothetical protein TRFO_36855 [Tritrichomonas foetus]|uniref:Importin N-terminal domain-containing protein n=1 Tax=Tritrichomonas foetus TaxID=1144522 RepID=A0A1J4JIH1_9EUKA|nr:hypothetical protein TRFO_36855 [Tritrichomonas foetus]|eukprot:OHS96996.1 hypothetical protein TRFO_36855 [Tritrichomonas foetus]
MDELLFHVISSIGYQSSNQQKMESAQFLDSFLCHSENLLITLLLLNNTKVYFHQYAISIILRHIVKDNWDKNPLEVDQISSIMNEILIFLRKDIDMNLLSYFLFAIGPIIKSDLSTNEIFQKNYGNKIFGQSIDTIIRPFTFASSTIENLPEEYLVKFKSYFLSLSQFAFGTTDDSLIILASQMITKLIIHIEDPAESRLSGPFEFVMQTWAKSLSNPLSSQSDTGQLTDLNKSISLTACIEDVIKNKMIPYDPDTTFDFLMSLSTHDLSNHSVCLLFGIIQEFIKNYGKYVNSIENSIPTIINSSALVFEDGFLSHQSDMLFVLDTLDLVFKCIHLEKIIVYLLEQEIPESFDLLSAYLLSILHIIAISDCFLPYVNSILKILSNTLYHPYPCIQEITLETIFVLTNTLNYLNDYDNIGQLSTFYKPLYTLLKAKNSIVSYRCIKALIQIFPIVDIDDDLVEPILNLFFELYQEGFNKTILLEAISSAVSSAKSEIRPFSASLYQASLNALASNDLFLKSTSIKSVSIGCPVM